ncbi:MAG: tRNA (adenine-N1)-methyltransferase [Micrococcales bacterium]|nr:tRNA (adenine-N1)-methyltransferase [Micrococcales bacterium]
MKQLDPAGQDPAQAAATGPDATGLDATELDAGRPDPAEASAIGQSPAAAGVIGPSPNEAGVTGQSPNEAGVTGQSPAKRRAGCTRAIPTGAAERRGQLKPGERVQLTDAKGRHNTIILEAGKVFHSHRGTFEHNQIIGQDEGCVVTTAAGTEYLVLRPLLSDFVLSMPRGATVVYPKDAGQVVQMADIYPGARVAEAGVGSGALTMSLLRAVGDDGYLLSAELRPEFATIAKANVESWFGRPHPAWDLRVGDMAELLVAADGPGPGGLDRIVLDLLAPWDLVEPCAQALAPGGVLISYIATTTQLSRLVETLRDHGGYTEPYSWESIVRPWHVDSLAVRPSHRMVGHTGFLVTTRRLAAGYTAPARRRRPAPGAQDAEGLQWTAAAFGLAEVSERKLRRVTRAIEEGQAMAPEADGRS